MSPNLVWNPIGLTSNAEKVKEVERVVPVFGNLVICCKFLTVSSTKLCAWPLKHPTGKVSYSNRLQLPVSAVVGGEVEVFSRAVHSTNYTSFKWCDFMLLDDPDFSFMEQFLFSETVFPVDLWFSVFLTRRPPTVQHNIQRPLLQNDININT